ncbi:MAG: primase C-terminal domain-containing protein [Bacillota bacterium]|nr:primase C-terminal domain-containing protein [Bacillota bacterium]
MAQIPQPTVTEILQFMTHDGLEIYKRSGSSAPFQERVQYKRLLKSLRYQKGVVFVSPSKEKLTEGKGYIITSYETLHQKYNKLTHWTPNVFRGGTYYDFKARIIKGHTKDNLKQINVIGFDIDTKKVHPYDMVLACDELELPRPNLILETPNGYQGFFVLETPFFIHAQEDYKALRVAERLATNILQGLKKYLPIDLGCAPFGFYRIPNDGNVILFDDQPANTADLLSWSKEFEVKERKNNLRVIYNTSNASALDLTSSEWYSALLRATQIKSGYHGSSRNNHLLTLAIANYASDKAFEDAYNELDQFNSNIIHPLSKREFERTLRSAYSGKYKGPKRSYVEGLLELWTDGNAKFIGHEGWYKFKKPREERVRSHYEEREDDIIQYLEGCISPEKPFFTGSLRELAESFRMAVSTLKEVLKRSNRLIKQVVGSGRNASTMLTTKMMLFRSLLHQRKLQIKHSQMTFQAFLCEEYQLPAPFLLPNLDAAIKEIEGVIFGSVERNGTSPPIRYIS